MEPEVVLQRLREGDYAAILGCKETHRLDFKRSWYRLEEDRERAELAKDVVAMANHEGGFIVRGVATARLSTAEEEIAVAVEPIPVDKANVKQHRDVVRDWCYPQVKGVDFHWLPADGGEDHDRGVLVIEVPLQDGDLSPFLVTRVIDADGRRLEAFSIPVRDTSHTDWLPPGVIWRDLADGRRSRRRTEEPPPESVSAKPEHEVEGVEVLLDRLEQYMGWTDGAGYYLVARPTGVSARPSDFYSSDGLFGALSKPPTIRWAGFGLSYEETPERVGTDLVVASARERCLWLRHDGVFVAGANAKGEFLSWSYARDVESPSTVQINPIVLVEFTYLFATFVWDQLAPRYGAGWSYHVEIRGARDRSWNLVLPLRRMPPGIRKPTGDLMLEDIREAASAESDAYRIVAAVYDFFGASREAIPYVQDQVIDRDAIIEESKTRR